MKQPFPSRAKILRPIQMLEERPEGMTAQEWFLEITDALEDLESTPIGFEVIVDDDGASPEEEQEQREQFTLALDAFRSTYLVLTSASMKIADRTVAIEAPDVAPRFLRAKAAVLERIRHLRALLAFLTGEHDDEELGIEIVPPPSPIGPSKPTVDFTP